MAETNTKTTLELVNLEIELLELTVAKQEANLFLDEIDLLCKKYSGDGFIMTSQTE